jgi:hypothetical protein
MQKGEKMRLIDADALLEGRQDHEMISTHLIWNAPTIEAEPVRYGRWIVDDEFIDCSVCRSEKWSKVPYESLVRGFKHCPKCGARMLNEDPSHPFADSVMMGD